MSRQEARDSLRLAFGTLTVLPVHAPRVTPAVARGAMTLAPLVGLVVGGVATATAWLLVPVLDPLLLAVLVTAVPALASRLLHWDGLADTADGLGSGLPPGGALDVMRRSDIGPFGVFALVAVLLVQVAALDSLLARDVVGAALVAQVLGRCALPLACRSGVPAARPDGLGHAVAGTVGAASLAVSAILAAGALAAALLVDPRLGPLPVLAATTASLAWAGVATARLRHRLGGMTGDTLGALVETGAAVALVALAALHGSGPGA